MFQTMLFIGLWIIVTGVSAAELTLELPVCKMPPGKSLPDKYHRLAREREEFHWLRTVEKNAYVVRGNGPEVGMDGSQLYSHFEFSKIDINDDGLCDWILSVRSPIGNDKTAIVTNTFYLGSLSGWSRFGADIPDDRPDLSGYERRTMGSAEFTFFSGAPLIIRRAAENPVTYLVGGLTLWEANTQGRFYGYRIYIWDKENKTLKELEKWHQESEAAKVYAFFKKHGAVGPANEKPFWKIYHFNEEYEKEELEWGCGSDSVESEYFAALCKAYSSGEMPDQKATEHMATKPEKRLPASYAEMLEYSPALGIQDTYLNQAYRYLTTGQTILHEVPPGSKPGFYYCGLPREEIKALKTEQRAWIKTRDKQALEAGAFGTDTYIAALLEITKKRNVELKALIEKHPPKDDACRQLLPKE